jgi:hypothetical protein
VVRSNVANDRKASPHQGDKAQHRDGKENLHAPKKNTKCHAFVQLIPIPLSVDARYSTKVSAFRPAAIPNTDQVRTWYALAAIRFST